MVSILEIRLTKKNRTVFDFLGMEGTDTLNLVTLACNRAAIPHKVVSDFVEMKTNSIQYFAKPFVLYLTRDRLG